LEEGKIERKTIVSLGLSFAQATNISFKRIQDKMDGSLILNFP